MSGRSLHGGTGRGRLGPYAFNGTGVAALTATSMRFATAAGCETATEWEASISSMVPLAIRVA